MGELYRHTGIGELGHDHRLLPGFLLEGHDIVGKLVFLRVIGHVEQSEAHLTHAGIGDIEVTAAHNATDQRIGQGLTSLIMEGKGAQELFLDGVVLHEL